MLEEDAPMDDELVLDELEIDELETDELEKEELDTEELDLALLLELGIEQSPTRQLYSSRL